MRVPALDLSAEYLVLKEEIDAAVHEVLASGHFILGPNVQALESELAAFIGVKHAIGVGNGSDALYLALMALGVGPGDEVIVPDFTFFATAGAVSRTGARPVFVDVEAATFNLDVEKLAAAVTTKTKAIIPVHLYGQMADMRRIRALAAEHHLAIVEDAAQAISASRDDFKAGTAGDLACFSFFPTKNLGAYGDAGLVVTNDDQYAATVRMLRVHGSRQKYHHEMLGINSRLDELQAAILRVKLRHLDAWTERRRAIALAYDAGLKGRIPDLVTPAVPAGSQHVFHQYTIKVQNRERLQEQLRTAGVDSTVYYPVPLHRQPVFGEIAHDVACPVSDTLSQTALSLPVSPSLSEAQVDWVISVLVR